MNDVPPSPDFGVPPPPPPLQPGGADRPRSGCMKWGLIGCAGLSVLVIVALVFLGMRARNMMDWALGKSRDKVLTSCTADVTPEQKEAFRQAYDPFVARAKMGKISIDRMTTFNKKMVGALSDDRVTPEEITDLTAGLKQLSE